MNFKTTVTLLILLAIVAGFIVYDRMTSKPEAEGAKTEAKAEKLVAVPADVADEALEIAVEGAEKISLVRDVGANWRLVTPIAVQADNSAVASVLSRLGAAESKGTPGEAAQKDFKPAVTVSISGGPERVVVAVSAANGVGESVAKVEVGGKVTWKLAAGDLAEGLKKRPEELRDQRLVTALASEVRTVTLEQGGRWVRLVKDAGGGGEGTWTLDEGAGVAPKLAGAVKGGPVRADEAAVQELLSTLTGLRAAEFPKAAASGTTMPAAAAQLTVRYSVGNGGTTTAPTFTPETVVTFGRWEDARRERVLVTTGDVTNAAVTAYSMTGLKKTALDLRDKRVVDVRPAEVTRVEIVNEPEAATRPGVVVLTRKPIPATAVGAGTQPGTQPSSQPVIPPPTEWLVDGMPADGAKVEALLESLRPLRATKYLSGAAATQPSTPWLIRVTTAGGTSEVRVGESAGRFGGLVFEQASEVGTQVKGPFKAPPKPVPFIDAEPATQPSATQPGNGPATMPSTQP